MLKLALSAAKRLGAQAHSLSLRAAVALGGAGLGEQSRPRRLWAAYAIILPVASLTGWALPQLTWVISPSIEAWALRPVPGVIHVNDYVSFWLNDPMAGPRPVPVTKHALCLPGQLLTQIEKPSPHHQPMSDTWFYCDGHLIGITKPFGRKGQRLKPLAWGRRPIPAGFVYVGSRHPDGYDSRYYGLISLDRLVRMERVL